MVYDTFLFPSTTSNFGIFSLLFIPLSVSLF
jgi:hypothetical protein